MGGIFGIWNRNGTAVTHDEPVLMQEQLRGYGSNDDEIMFRENTAFGCMDLRLNSEIDESRVAFTEKSARLALVADAQIYNRKELIFDYSLSDNESISNSALLLAAYLRWGRQTPFHINGDFAFAVFDYEHGELLLFSDHLGVRPLYYYSDPETVVFATDAKTILGLKRVPKEPNAEMIYRLLGSDYAPLPEDTHVMGLRKVPQAHVITLSADSVEKEKYWTPGRNGIKIPKDEAECAREIKALIQSAVEMRVDSVTEPMGAELSGGLDSSVVTVFAARRLRERKEKLPVFCWAPSFALVPEQPRDERTLVEQVCAQENLECDYFSKDNTEEVAKILWGSNGGVLTEELRVFEGKKVRAVLSGWGGDQGITHRTNLSELWAAGYRKEFISEIRLLSKGSILRAAKLFFSNAGVGDVFRRLTSREKDSSGRILRPAFRKEMKARFKGERLQFNRDLLRHIESGNIQSRTHISAEVGSRFSIQFVFPLLDYRLVDYALSMPRHLFYKNGVNRYLPRKALEGILPEPVRRYVPKDDIVRCTFVGSKQEDAFDAQSISVEGIRRELFDRFIDFKKLDNLIGSEQFKKNRRLRKKVARKIQTIKEIQADYD